MGRIGTTMFTCWYVRINVEKQRDMRRSPCEISEEKRVVYMYTVYIYICIYIVSIYIFMCVFNIYIYLYV